MAKRKREIQKRKKQQDPGSVRVDGTEGAEAAPNLLEDADPEKAGHLHDRPVGVCEPKREKPPRTSGPVEKVAPTVGPQAVLEDTWFSQNKENLLLGLLVIYVFLLGLGTVGELFEIEWILNLPLFK